MSNEIHWPAPFPWQPGSSPERLPRELQGGVDWSTFESLPKTRTLLGRRANVPRTKVPPADHRAAAITDFVRRFHEIVPPETSPSVRRSLYKQQTIRDALVALHYEVQEAGLVLEVRGRVKISYATIYKFMVGASGSVFVPNFSGKPIKDFDAKIHAEKIRVYLQEHGVTGARELMIELGGKRSQFHAALDVLRSDGVLRSQGRTKSKVYFVAVDQEASDGNM